MWGGVTQQLEAGSTVSYGAAVKGKCQHSEPMTRDTIYFIVLSLFTMKLLRFRLKRQSKKVEHHEFQVTRIRIRIRKISSIL